MTLVAALSSSTSSILIADSRISFPDDSGKSVEHKDVGQKVIRLGNEALVGYSGDLESAHRVLRGFSGTYQARGKSWITSASEVEGLFRACGVGPNDPTVSITCTFIDDSHEVLPGVPGAALISFNSKSSEYSKKYLGLSIIGSGSSVQKKIEDDLGISGLLSFAGFGDDPRTLVQKAMFMAKVMESSAQMDGISSVGGLFQIHLVTRQGVFAIPYEQWVDIDDSHGTYARMDIDDKGGWIQEHVPTGLRIPLGLIGQDKLNLSSRNLSFELKSRLTTSSAGVVRKQNPQIVYKPIGDDWVLRTP